MYPLAPAETIPGSDPFHSSGAIGVSDPLVVCFSVIGGSMLLTWSVFALRHRTLTPLTPRRVLLAPLLGILGIGAGVGRFTYEWTRATPFVWGDSEQTTADPSLLEIVLLEFTGVQFVALAAVSAMVVGAVASRRDHRATIASVLLPLAFVVLAVVWDGHTPITHDLFLMVSFAIVPFTVGYLATHSK
ncbi:hypothetical protein OB955_03850 [Halobacteria archaeon AArc-m2/3/4]|uniref:Uncharacterized protein n=2 Tax=Natronoglomus mannanivorans TaxID=2979990 RepID=A0ABT2QAG1_9EURY|nr:hypothetical protein [Halobacteria archaeon AArc-m2/3/4]